MARAPYFDKNGVKKGAWSEDEDNKLRAYIKKCGHSNWRDLPRLAGLSRCGKSCRLRWMNYLRPNIKHGNFTKEEEDIIVALHNKHGNKWSMMATLLPGRSDNEIKNHWHTHLKNRARKDHQTMLTNEKFKSLEPASLKECLIENSNLKTQQEVEILLAVLSSKSPSSCTTKESSSCSLSVSDYAVPSDVTPDILEPTANLWTEPFFLDNDGVGSSSYNMFSPLRSAEDHISQASFQDYTMDDVLLW